MVLRTTASNDKQVVSMAPSNVQKERGSFPEWRVHKIYFRYFESERFAGLSTHCSWHDQKQIPREVWKVGCATHDVDLLERLVDEDARDEEGEDVLREAAHVAQQAAHLQRRRHRREHRQPDADPKVRPQVVDVQTLAYLQEQKQSFNGKFVEFLSVFTEGFARRKSFYWNIQKKLIVFWQKTRKLKKEQEQDIWQEIPFETSSSSQRG